MRTRIGTVANLNGISKALRLAAGCAAVGGALCAHAATWIGASGGKWSDAANWQDGDVPNAAGAEADFSAASGTYAVSVDAAVTVGKITLDGAAAATLTLSGSKLTFSGGGSDIPEICVGNGSTLISTMAYGGTQNVRKTGAGLWKPTAQAAANSFSGNILVVEGQLQVVKNNDAYFAGGLIEVQKGGTFTLITNDTFPNNYRFRANGGTVDFANRADYVGALSFLNGGVFKAGKIGTANSGFVHVDNAAVGNVYATGTGDAGTFIGKFLANSCYGVAAGFKLAVRTNQIDVADGASFAMTGNIYEHLAQTRGSDIYMEEYRPGALLDQKASLRKTGAGDLVFYDETLSLTAPVTVDAGRLVLSNTVKMAGAVIDLGPVASRLVLREGATLQVGGVASTGTGAVDLNGNTLDLGGVSGDAAFAGAFANGKIRKTGWNTQTVGALAQRDLDILGGTLALGLPAPKVCYTFDDADNLGADAGTLGKTLALETDGAAVYAEDGVRGGCAAFNGTGCLLADTAAGLPSGNAPFTIALWIKTTATRENLSFTSWGAPDGNKYNGFLLASSTTLKHTFWEGSSVDFTSKAAPASLADGTWHHIALTYDPTTNTRTYYLDGATFDSQVNTQYTRTVPEANPFKVGFSQNSTYFIGQMDEVQIYDTVLSAAQIAQVKDATATGAALGNGGAVRIHGDATLALRASDATLGSLGGRGTLALLAGANATVPAGAVGRVTGDGTLTKTGAGTLALTSAANLGATIDVQGGAVTAAGPSVDADLKSHLIAWWDFDDHDNPGYDRSGHGMTLVCTNKVVMENNANYTVDAVHWRNRFETMGGAVRFDGVAGHFLSLADKANEAKIPGGAHPQFTIAMWINPDPTTGANSGLCYWGAPTATQKKILRLPFQQHHAIESVDLQRRRLQVRSAVRLQDGRHAGRLASCGVRGRRNLARPVRGRCECRGFPEFHRA